MGLLPIRGDLYYNSENIKDSTLEERVLMGIALVPEKRELFSTMTVEVNLELGGFRQMRLHKSSTNLKRPRKMAVFIDVF